MKTILITGGTGFLGHALVEHLLGTDIRSIRILSRNEGNQAAMEVKFADPRLRFILGDVNDPDMCLRACDGVEGVIHAAALKQIKNGLHAPWYVTLINAGGTENIANAARDAGVYSVVLVSSDKAYAPVPGAYGASKLIAEQIFLGRAWHRLPGHPLYHVVRYGNVWGSTGSVVPRWRSLLAGGGTIRVTSTEATRFFMDRKEAVDFVLGALNGEHPPGLVAIPNWLPAYDIKTLLEAMEIKEYVITGLPFYEKLHESMGAKNEDGSDFTSGHARRMSVEELRSYL